MLCPCWYMIRLLWCSTESARERMLGWGSWKEGTRGFALWLSVFGCVFQVEKSKFMFAKFNRHHLKSKTCPTSNLKS